MSSSVSSEASGASSTSADLATESNLANPAVSEKFRTRMLPCKEAVAQRSKCPCCGRNFRDANDCLAKFRDSLQVNTTGASAAAATAVANSSGNSLASEPTVKDFSETERKVLLSDDFLRRVLARCGCDFKKAQERLLVAAAVHRKYSLDASNQLGCKSCADNPGYHSFRQVGFDRAGRPVLYTCLNQDLETGTQPEQIKAYFLHLILAVREAEKTIPESQHSLVFVFDTTGLGMHHVRTDSVAQFGEMLRYFPSRMSYALLLNMNTMTRFLLKPIIHLTGHQDDVLVLPSNNIEKQLSECFEDSLVQWMVREVERNKQPKMQFCKGPTADQPHDPRGEASYVEKYVKLRHKSGHKPHPSIVAANPTIHGS